MNSVKPIPDGMHTITPHLVCDGAAAAIDSTKTPSAPSNWRACRAPTAS